MKFHNKAFILINPPSKVLIKAVAESQEELDQLYKQAKEKKALVYYAELDKKEDIIQNVKQPWVLDESTITNIDLEKDVFDVPKANKEVVKRAEPPDTKQASKVKPTKKKVVREKEPDPDLMCPYCNKQLNSLSGKTLHIKNKHPENA